MTNYGAKVSRIGYPVESASDKQLAFSSDWPLLPIEAEGEITITANGGAPVTQDIYTHNLGYTPIFIIERLSGNKFYFPMWGFGDATKIWFSGFITENITLKWKIFRRPIKTNYTAPIFNSTDATKQIDSDYGILVSLPGKDVNSTDKRDFGIRSDTRQLMVAKSGYTDGSTNGLSVNHNLGYKPMYLAYVQGLDDNYELVENRFRMASEADDLLLTATATTFNMTLYSVPFPQMAYVLFKDTLTANG